MPTRPLARAIALLVVVALLLPAAAGAQQAPSLGAPTETQAPPVVTTSSNPADRGLKTWQEVLIFGAGVILLVGIAVAIIGDARERAPVEDRHRRGGELDTAGGTRVSPHERRRRKERARAKGRAARRARKQNR